MRTLLFAMMQVLTPSRHCSPSTSGSMSRCCWRVRYSCPGKRTVSCALGRSRRSADLGDDRMEYLREEQARLEFLHEERRSLANELKREQRLEKPEREHGQSTE